MQILFDVVRQALVISGLVFVMMLVIEYLNVLTRGNWDRIIAKWTWRQSIFGAFLGVTPGCLGSFAVSSLYMHRVLTFGALLATMIATSGDEAFVMLALFPGRALVLFATLFVVGSISGIVFDRLFGARLTAPSEHLAHYQAAHTGVPDCIPFSRQSLIDQWRHCTAHRGWLSLFLALFVAGIATGSIGHQHPGLHADAPPPHETVHEAPAAGHTAHAAVHGGEARHHDHDGHAWDWARVTLLLLGLVGLAIVATVPDHFLDAHLWNHIVRIHIGRVLLWTLGALLVVQFLTAQIDIQAAVEAHRLPVLLLACLIGLIPESGPHLVFVTLYAGGLIPFSTLLASSIVQDGHGMIPILAHSRRAFMGVKAINFTIGLGAGLLGYFMGW